MISFQAKFEICYLEKKISKKNWISWILEFFGFFGKDEFYRENLVGFFFVCDFGFLFSV